MVETLRELNKICQKPNYKTVGNWMVRHILRDAALPCTWLLLHTPITANQVTAIALAIGLAGCYFMAGTTTFSFFLAVVCLQLWYYLDHVDGQIARYRKTASLTGRFFDFLMHHLVHGVIFFPWGWHMWQRTDSAFYLFLGFLLSMLMMTFNMIPDITYKAFFEKLSQDADDKMTTPRVSQEKKSQKEKEEESAFKEVYSFLHKTCEMHVMMNALTVAAILEVLFWHSFPSRSLLFTYYSVVIAIIVPAKIAYVIKTKKPDKEFLKYFHGK